MKTASSAVIETRVLVVEDHEDCLVTMVELLSLSGCEVRAARTGSEAVAIAKEFLPDLMFLDLGMPVISGFEVAQEIRSDSRTAEMMIVAVTGYGTQRERTLATDAGVDMILVKPVPFAQLYLALKGVQNRPGAQATRP
jgi:DNA-binding response OmpR family regulator